MIRVMRSDVRVTIISSMISGTVVGIEAAEAKLRDAGVRVQRLPVATAFHSPIVASSSEPFAKSGTPASRTQIRRARIVKNPRNAPAAANPHATM